MTKLKLLGGLFIAFALVGFGYTLGDKPTPTATVTEKTVFVDRIVEKKVLVDKTKTTKLPDGTTIVETDKSSVVSNTLEHKAVADVRRTSTASEKPKYSVGLAVGRKADSTILTQPNIYNLTFGYRLMESPIWLTTNVSTDRTILLGARFDF